jgi:glycosyltransferase involved in cell wall biosynthesis
MPRVLIYAPDIWQGDAVGEHCINLKKILDANNIKCKIYAQRGSDNILPADIFFTDISSDDLIYVSYSIFDSNLELIATLPNKKICYFHGVTPFELLLDFDPITADLCKKSIGQFHILEQFDLILSNSINSSKTLLNFFNERKKILSIPPIIKSKFYGNDPLEKKISNKATLNLVSIGRIVPHKRIEDSMYIIRGLIHKGVNAKLKIIGKFDDNLYTNFLTNLVKSLNLYKDVEFLGFLSNDKKISVLTNSDFLISTSLHEGFGIPILEAMCLGIPFLTSKGAISEEIVKNFPTSFSNINEAVDILCELFLDKDKILSLIKLGHHRADYLLSSSDDKVYINIFNSFLKG